MYIYLARVDNNRFTRPHIMIAELLIVSKIKNITTHRRSVPLYNTGLLNIR